MRNHLGDRDISIVPLGLGLQSEIGAIVRVRARGFSAANRETDSQRSGGSGVHRIAGALLGEQKRVAGELDLRVAQRTTELAAANEDLRKEIADRKHAEENMRSSEEKRR